MKVKNLIEILVEQVLDELMEPQEPTVYFDMDGVLANFQGAIEKDEAYNKARSEFERLAKEYMPELLDYHSDELRAVFKGRQEDPIKAKLKKLWNKRRSASFTVAGKPGHFRNLEPLPGATEMMRYAAKLLGKKPHILTAPMESAPNCKEEKREWVDEHVAGLFDEFHCTQNKDHFAKSEFDILIDDRPKYINKFRAAGGTAIYYQGDPKATMNELEEIVAELKGQNQ